MELMLTKDRADALAVLSLFLESLIVETLSPDVIALAASRTASRAAEMEIHPVTVQEIIEKMVTFAKARQAEHPFAALF